MAFLLKCPNCGERSVYEFRFGGEVRSRPDRDALLTEWLEYVYQRKNVMGIQREWLYHKFGCRKWFVTLRDTRSNLVSETFWPEGPGE